MKILLTDRWKMNEKDALLQYPNFGEYPEIFSKQTMYLKEEILIYI